VSEALALPERWEWRTARPGLGGLPRLRLAGAPLPFHHLPGLSGELGLDVWTQREDRSWLAAGGNKLRKLEYLLADALAEEADTVITTGAPQSNHAAQTATACAMLGLRCHLALRGRDPGARRGNLFIDSLMEAEVSFHDQEAGAMTAVMERLAAEMAAAGRRPCVVPGGGSSALGALGFAECAIEIAAHARAAGLSPAALVCASGTAGTHAGLLAGTALAGAPWEVLGVSVTLADERISEKARRLAQGALRLAGSALDPPAFEVVLDQVGDGYGAATPAGGEAARLAARRDGLILDAVYTAKAFAGLLAAARAGRWRPGSTIVFVHTGGLAGALAQPA
jgi:D-cysteine desulfhydrase family pyridoxal phosphate-dependent enzyme